MHTAPGTQEGKEMTTTREYHAAVKVNGWVIDEHGRTDALPWRCWRIDTDTDLNNRQKSFATRQEAEQYAASHN